MIKHVSLLLFIGPVIGGCSQTTSTSATTTKTTQALVNEITGDAQGARNDARALRRDSDALLTFKDYNGAMEKRLQMLSLRGKDASTFGALTASAVQRLALGDVETIASHLDASSCRRYAAELQALEAQVPNYAAIIRTEKITAQQQLAKRSRNPRVWKLIISELGRNAQEQQALNKMPPAQIKANIENYCNARIKWALQPYGTRWVGFPVDPYTRTVISYLTEGRFIWTLDKTERALVMVALQKRADQLEKKQPRWTLPGDPFGTGPLKQKNGVIYSVGPDTKDDGGKAIPRLKSVQIRDKGDIPVPVL